jgi:hypothetical protein
LHTYLAKNPIQPQNKIKPRERKQVIQTSNKATKNIVAQYQVEQWEEEKGIENILLPKII